MKNSEHLFFFIKSLTKSEKRSFKLFAKNNAKEGVNNYTILFDAIDRMTTYDHDLLIKKVKGKISSKNISTIKVQLNGLILKSLRNNSSVQSVSTEVRMNLDYLNILYEKGLYNQFKKMVVKVKQMARENSLYILLDEISILEVHVAMKQSSHKDLKHYINVTYPEVKQARKFNDILADYEYLSVGMKLLLLESSSIGGDLTSERLNEIVSHPLLKLTEKQIKVYPEECQIEYHTIWGHYHFAIINKNESYYNRKKALTLYEESFSKSGGTLYLNREWLSYVRYLLVALTTYKMFDKFDEELARINEVIDSIPESKQGTTFLEELSRTLENIKFHRDLDGGNFSEIATYIDDVEASFLSSIYLMDTSLKMAFHFNMSYAYFGMGEYKKALRWNNDLLNNPEMRSMREDILSYAMILNICIHNALGNFMLIPSLIQSVKRFLGNHNRLNPLEITFIQFSSKVLTQEFDFSNSQIVRSKIDELKAISSKENDIMLDYVDVISWLESLLLSKSMEEIIHSNK